MADPVEAPDLPPDEDTVMKSVVELLASHRSQEEQEKRAAKLAADVGLVAEVAQEIGVIIRWGRVLIWPVLILLLNGDARGLIEAIGNAKSGSTSAADALDQATVAKGAP